MGMYGTYYMTAPSDQFQDADEVAEALEVVRLEVFKDWDLAHFLLTGQGAIAYLKACQIEEGSQIDGLAHQFLLGEVCLGWDLYAGENSPEKVKELAAYVQELDIEALASEHFDLDNIVAAKVYPNVWDDEAAAERRKRHALDELFALREFYQKAAALERGIVFTIV